ncbi:UNVERIFIED_CONTAM: hypothetical protein RMT77_003315 [Armadillidium vulgare]
MGLRMLVYIVPLIFSICMQKPSGGYGFGYRAYPIQDCAEDSTYFGYCVDCETRVECNNGITTQNQTCSYSQACQVKSVYSACSDITDVPDCFCPQNETVKKPDPYDDTKYLLCTDGERYMFKCPEGEIYDNETQSCHISTTPLPSGCPGDINIKIYLNCTCFRYCFNDGNYADSCCPAGEIFDESTEQCEVFEFFSCTDREDGRYVDNHNCSIYHTCVEGELFATDYCQEGLVFNETTGLCEEGDCDEIPDCGVCPDDQTFIKIDCHNFYDCRENTEFSDPEFVPVPEKCPEDSCFNEETGSCEENSQLKQKQKSVL